MMDADTDFVALIDIDDVLSDSVPVYLSHINKELGTSYSARDVQTYDFTGGLGIPYELVVRITTDPGVLTELAPLPGAAEGISLLRSIGFRIVIITSRKEPVRTVTETWLHRHGFPYDQLIMNRNKASTAHEFSQGFTIAFEDRWDTAAQLKEYVNYVFLFSKWWNDSASLLSNMLRLEGWQDIIDMINYKAPGAQEFRAMLDDNYAKILTLASYINRKRRQGSSSHIWLVDKLLAEESVTQHTNDDLHNHAMLAQLEPLFKDDYINLLITTRTDDVLERYIESLHVDRRVNVLVNGMHFIEDIIEQIEKQAEKQEIIIFKVHGNTPTSRREALEREFRATTLLRQLLRRETIILGTPIADLTRYLEHIGSSMWYITDSFSPISETMAYIMQQRDSETNVISGIHGQPYNFIGSLNSAISSLVPEISSIALPQQEERSPCIRDVPAKRFDKLIGRREQFRKIQTLLSPSNREYVVSIAGIGGVGKTALALEIVHSYIAPSQVSQLGFDTIIWISVPSKILLDKTASIDEAILDVCITRIASVLEQPAVLHAKREEQIALIYSILAKKNALLIIDGLEGDHYPNLTEFINNVPMPTKFLITSENPFNLGYSIRLSPMSQEDAIDLIEQESEYHAVPMNNKLALDLYDYTNGIPIAIVWAIGQLKRRNISREEIKHLNQLDQEVCTEIFQKSIDSLINKLESLKTLYMLSLFSGVVYKDVLAATLSSEDSNTKFDIGLLDTIIDQAASLNLITVQHEEISMLSLAKKFFNAYFLQYNPREPQQYKLQWVTAMANLASKHAPEYWNFNGYTHLMMYMDDFKSALEWCLKHEWIAESYALMRAFSFGCIYAGQWRELLELAGRFKKLMQNKKHWHAVAWAESCIIGWVLSHQKALSDAESSLKAALSLYQDLHDCRGVAQTTRLLGRLRLEQRNYAEARALLSSARQQMQELDWRSELGFANYDLGWLFLECSRQEGSIEGRNVAKGFLEEAQSILQDAMEPAIAGLFTTGVQEALANIAFEEGNYQEAEDLCTRALHFYNLTPKAVHGYRPPRIQLLQARSMEKLGKISEAIRVAENVLAAVESLGMRKEQVMANELMASLLKALNGSAPPMPLKKIRNAFALVVGINSYESLPKLSTPLLDATAVYETLIDPQHQQFDPTNVIPLLDREATKSEISRKLEWLARHADEDATVIVYFSGHGIRKTGGFYPGEYLCPIETNLDNPITTAITSNILTNALQAIRSRKLLLVLDACHAGAFNTITREASNLTPGFSDTVYNNLSTGSGRVVLASSAAQEYSYEKPDLAYSLFTHFFLEALRGRVTREDGFVHVYDLADHVQRNVQKQNHKQHPVFTAINTEENFVVI